ANAALSYVSYLGKTFWPASLAVFYPHPHGGLTPWPLSGSIVLLAAFTWLSLRFARRAPYVAFGWLWYLGTLVPVIGLVQVGQQAMADRYTYLPLIGIFVAIAWGVAEPAKRYRSARHAIPAACAALVLALSLVTRVQVGHWADDFALFEHALAVTSDNWLAHANLAGALAGEGRADEAIEHLEFSLRIVPGNAEAHYNLAKTLFKAGRIDEAIGHYDQSLRLRPDDAEAHDEMGDALARTGRYAEAIEHYERALRLKPDRVEALNGLGLALARSDRLPEAIESYQRALRIRPGFAEAHNNLGVALARSNRVPEALGQFREALRIKPDLGDARANLQRAEEALRPPR
ncbi:MAG: tetratricopeptide repeat protein, partial [Acidobacteriia bacterium]|nr:tetratricopeptide repeat protein [Terriglobia bacterium]